MKRLIPGLLAVLALVATMLVGVSLAAGVGVHTAAPTTITKLPPQPTGMAPNATTAYPANWILNYGAWTGHNITVSSNQGWHIVVYAGVPGSVDAKMDQLVFQPDCNLVKYHYDTSSGRGILLYVAWASHTNGYRNCTLAWQVDGNVVIYTPVGARWASRTNRGTGISYAYIVQNNMWTLIQQYTGKGWVTIYAVQFG